MSDLLNRLTIRQLRRRDYQQLALQCHLSAQLPPTTALYALTPRPRYATSLPPLLAIVAYATPLAHLRIRDTVTSNYFQQPPTRSDRLKLLNKSISYLCRLVVDNRFHRRGLARHLLDQTIHLSGKPIVELLTPHNFLVPLFVSLGFHLYLNPPPHHYQTLRHVLAKLRIHPNLYAQPETVHKRIDALAPKLQRYAKWQLAEFVARHRSKRYAQYSLAQIAFVLSKLDYPTAYLVKIHPNHPLNPGTPTIHTNTHPPPLIMHSTSHKERKQKTLSSTPPTHPKTNNRSKPPNRINTPLRTNNDKHHWE